MAVLFAMSGGAFAAAGGFSSGGKLQACVNEEGGLKLLKAGKHCKRGLKTVGWSIAGPKGATGAAGAKGAAGAAGAAGAQGPAGAPNPSATSVNGQSVTRIFATVAPAAPAVQVLSVQGLTLQYSCPTSVETLVTATGLPGGTDNLVWQGNGNAGAFQGRTEALALTPSTIGKGNYGSGVAQFG
ncbi:MAG TPA: hypothetical protein VLT58_10060, partial [Polyangia bacterium]|nr:hypothetical protein [Polyangia bacterium]